MMFDAESLQTLKSQLAGSLLQPGEREYDQARMAWNLAIDQHPALILLAGCATDVMAGVNFARAAGLPVAVQSTGHGVKYSANNSLLIITSRMAGVHIDAEARTARVEAGAVWQQVIDRTAPFGLAPLLGSSPHVGVVGYTLGGGVGWLARKYGLAADSVRWIDLVTPDGQLRRASPSENRELFWGLRGGGGNFGVVTALEFDLYPEATLYGGSLVYPLEQAGEVLRFFREWVKTVPDDLTSSLMLFKFPLIPQVPAHLHGQVVAILRAAYAGPAGQGQALIQPWLDWQAPMQNTFSELPFAAVGTISNDPVDPVGSAHTNVLFDVLSDAAIDTIVQYAADPGSPLLMSEIRHLGGAIARPPAESALNGRDASFFLHLAGITPTPEVYELVQLFMAREREMLHPHTRGGLYLNFSGGSEVQRRVKEAYPDGTRQRLLALKEKYDPQNLFRFGYPLSEKMLVTA